MHQQSSQHKQVLKAASTTAFIMMFDSENKTGHVRKNQPVHYTSHQNNLQHAITIRIIANTRGTSITISGHARRRLSWLDWFYGNHYYDCKKRYSISLTLVIHVNKKLKSYRAGYPGACHDSYAFSNIQISQQPEKFFDQNQFLLEDSAYT
ncbi:uncharacterized protein VP01_10693g1, partial [Puccinia sorghi]